MKIETLIFGLLVLVSCKSSNEMKSETSDINFNNSTVPRPHVLVYKTKNDYRNLVPVLLSEDKKEIISYPDPKDLKIDDTLLLPTLLQNAYLLDNKGINENVAFLKYTYEEYSNLKSPPKLKELYKSILDRSPLLELYNCDKSKKFKDSKTYLNKIDMEYLKNECEVIELIN